MAPGVKGAYAKPGGQSSIPRLHRVEGGSPKLPSHCHRHRSLYTHRHTNRKGAWEVPQWPKVLANDRQTNVVGLGVWVFRAEQKKEKAGWWHTPVTRLVGGGDRKRLTNRKERKCVAREASQPGSVARAHLSLLSWAVFTFTAERG